MLLLFVLRCWVRGTPEETRRLIRFRAENEQRFMKSKAAAKQLWETLVKDLGLQGTITSQQASKKWENLKKKYKELKTPKTGSGTDAGETTACTWQFFEEMHDVLGSRPSIYPPVVVASFAPDADPIPLFMELHRNCSRELKLLVPAETTRACRNYAREQRFTREEELPA
ncbi:hypothetical protein ACEWY4_012544 [Coilia grayii]|uniref:Myb/SANT-like DNA-binding domain-containing protein n=1 Tax=Coilia grayii TaxID=363190 RepID=A0ABD1K0Z5_9TELE